MKESRLPCFELEEWFRRFAFVPGMVNLSPSNPVSPTVGDLLELTGTPLSDLRGLSLDYSQTAGVSSLRQAVAALYEDLDAEQVVVTSGATEAVLLVLEAIIDRGARVVIESPLYGIYEPLLHLLGAEVTRYELAARDGFEYDFDRLEQLVRTSRRGVVDREPVQQPDRTRTGECLLARHPCRAVSSCRLSGDKRRRVPLRDPSRRRAPLTPRCGEGRHLGRRHDEGLGPRRAPHRVAGLSGQFGHRAGVEHAGLHDEQQLNREREARGVRVVSAGKTPRFRARRRKGNLFAR